MRYRVTLGDPGDDRSLDYGTYETDTPAEAATLAAQDSDPTRQYGEPVLLSTHRTYGHGGHTQDGSGNGAADRSAWWYVVDDLGATAIFAVAEAAQT